MPDLTDLPVCVIGDSFVAGFGDETGRGWTGLLEEHAAGDGGLLHVTEVGVGGDTSEMILARWDEIDRRLESWPGTAVIAEFGVNDVMLVDGVQRVDEAGTLAALRGMIDRAPDGRFLVVGPPPIAWDDVHQRIDPGAEINERIAARSSAIGAACAGAGVPFVPTYDALLADAVWMSEVAARDGAHPGSAGYERFVAVVAGPVLDWLGGLGWAHHAD